METIMKMDKNSVRERLMVFLCRNFMVDEEDIILDESLIDQGIIDSMGLVEITAYIEKEYAFKVTEEHMNRQNFGSVYRITDFILRITDSL